MTRKIDYQFTAVPTHLNYCMDNNCRCTLSTLIQLSDYFESKNVTAFDGWFFRTNALLEEQTNLSKNVLNGALDALFQAGVIDIIPQEKGKGKAQGARKYKVNFETFTKYDAIPFDECSCSNPDYGIVTLDYKKGAPSFQQRPQLEEQPRNGKSDNNRDNIDNTESIDVIEKQNIDNIDNTLIYNNLNTISCHSEEDLKSQNDERPDREIPYHSKDTSVTALEGFTSNSSDNSETETETAIQAPEEPNLLPPSPSITAEFIDSQIPFVYSRVKRLGAAGEPDNYTDAANVILDEYGREVSNWIACVKSKTLYSDSAMNRLVETINERVYADQGECEKTALDLMDYAAKIEVQYEEGLRTMLYS